MSTAIVLYDGVCPLCHWAVRFIIRHDPGGTLRFASLQSDFAKHLLTTFGFRSNDRESVIILRGRKVLVEAEAVFELLTLLRGVWRLLRVFQLLPRSVTRGMYRMVARHRYHVFGRYDECPLPPPEWKERFLD